MKKVINTNQLLQEDRWVLSTLLGNITSFNSTFNQNHILHFSNKNGFSPFLYYLTTQKQIQLPEKLTLELKKAYFTSLLRNTKILTIRDELNKLFSANNLKPLLLKGCTLATSIYPDPALRPMSDIDILFFNNDAEKAHELLIASGGTCSYQEKEHDKRTGHQLPGIMYKGIHIEIHRSLFDTDLNYNISNPYLAKNLECDNTQINSELNFSYLALHAYYTMRRGGIRLSWFLDLILLTKKESLSDKLFNHHIFELNIVKPVYLIIAYTEYIFQYRFDFISDNYRKILTQKEKEKLLELIYSTDQQNTNYSYALALERLKNTKGLYNKIKFIKSVLSNNNTSKSIVLRWFHLSARLMKYIVSRLINKKYNE
nr:nucleotidyltransferase family protein [uncultured Carboxylicivirga sp.]